MSRYLPLHSSVPEEEILNPMDLSLTMYSVDTASSVEFSLELMIHLSHYRDRPRCPRGRYHEYVHEKPPDK
ncbi:hypothetical protein AVEN_83976-1 [Araneus ventricosus]|uniref:Uncharacterized protein n=1 Tax=Araneus ventricosus TaxID=182803 RepID=A0A4Y2BR41_ARAVE|nr:hypothetical protein AVEN_83976-1 [Araneus ventricosus]